MSIAEMRSADVCVIGSGPVGLKVALDLARHGLKVALIESGGDGELASVKALSAATLSDPARHAPMELAVRRGFGGTSLLWGGRCVAFDDIDFAERAHVPLATWPIAAAEVARWYPTAAEFLDCGPPVFEAPWPEATSGTDGLRLDRLERWCRDPDMRRRRGDEVLRHPGIIVGLGCTATRIAIDPVVGRVLHVDVSRVGMIERLTPRATVVAAGGLETARLLLASRLEQPALFGGPEGALGRYYMGHVFGAIADIVFHREHTDRQFLFTLDQGRRYVRRRLTLDASTQMENALLNCALWPELPALYDPAHGSGVLSLAYLALAMPVVGPRLISEAIRRRKIGPGPARPSAHILNVIRDLPAAMRFALGFTKARYLSDVRLPGFFLTNPGHRYELHFHAEQAPDASSRVWLGQERDSLGMPRLHIDLRPTERDALSVVRTHEVLAEGLQRSGIARLEHRYPGADRAGAVLAQASDGFHQIGTARMSDDPRRGVVDRDARVHGVRDLYLAGSAIFPSSGQANPTLLAVALGARLAAHIARALAP